MANNQQGYRRLVMT